MRRAGRNNVVQFPSSPTSGQALKLFAMLFYGFVAYVLVFGFRWAALSLGTIFISEEGITTLLILGLMYNFLVRHRVQRTGYFKKNAVVVGLLLVAFLLVYQMGTLFFLGLAGIYWLLIARTGKEAPYFLKFHLVTALILNFFILMVYLIAQSALSLVATVLKIAHLAPWDGMLLLGAQSIFPLMGAAVFSVAAGWLALSAMMGRTPYLPTVTNNVRAWV